MKIVLCVWIKWSYKPKLRPHKEKSLGYTRKEGNWLEKSESWQIECWLGNMLIATSYCDPSKFVDEHQCLPHSSSSSSSLALGNYNADPESVDLNFWDFTKYINRKKFKYAIPVYVTGTYLAPLRIHHKVKVAIQLTGTKALPILVWKISGTTWR